MTNLLSWFSWNSQLNGVLLYLSFIALNTFLNWLLLPRLGQAPPPPTWPAVAVLVPARNEAANIRRCLTSLLAQDYPDFNVWVLDDASTDATPRILAEMAHGEPRLHVGQGAPLPAGWLGKNWACQQLAAQIPAETPLLLFVDADTWHAPDMLRQSVAVLLAYQAGLLSVLPQQETHTLAEMLTVPLLPWALLSHFPLWLTQRVRWPRLSAAVGQYMLWRRSAYQQVGGHAAVRAEVAEDLALARQAATHGVRGLLVPGRRRVFCRMYRSTADVVAGFGKNLFAVFERRLLIYGFVWTWLGITFLGPWLASAWVWLGGGGVERLPTELAVLLTLLIWGLVVRLSGMRSLIVLLSPLTMASAVWLTFHSMGQTLSHRSTWKGRPLA